MIKINLRHYYPHYTSDVYIEVPDNIAIDLHTFENADAASRMRRRRNRAYYSLDREDGFERELLNRAPSNEDEFFSGASGMLSFFCPARNSFAYLLFSYCYLT